MSESICHNEWEIKLQIPVTVKFECTTLQSSSVMEEIILSHLPTSFHTATVSREKQYLNEMLNKCYHQVTVGIQLTATHTCAAQAWVCSVLPELPQSKSPAEQLRGSAHARSSPPARRKQKEQTGWLSSFLFPLLLPGFQMPSAGSASSVISPTSLPWKSTRIYLTVGI